MSEFIEKIKSSLSILGMRRVITLALVGLIIFISVALASYRLSRPTQEVLYTGLDLQDIGQIGAALEEANIAFDVNAEGTAILVDTGHTAEARMLLAEKGLPKGDKSGYELFDNLGSLGLTSFMQQITKVRALEGELARTIQLMKGIKAARVHIVMPQEASFRSIKEPPSASVIIRADEGDAKNYAPAVQQLVASAIPGMTKDMVTVLGTDGTILANASTSDEAGPDKMVTLERQLAKDIEERVSMTLAPALGLSNFRISVAAKLNIDKKETNETIFDPESRVERSIKTVKELGESQNKNNQQSVTVEQNIPTETTPASSGDQSSEKNDKREELTNYEINSKLVATKREGYDIENISLAIIINKAQLLKTIGASASPDKIESEIKELQTLASSAAGLNEKRGDNIKLSAVDFLLDSDELQPIASSTIWESLTKNIGTIINGLSLIIITLLIVLFGLKPALKSILEVSNKAETENEPLSIADNHNEIPPELAAIGGLPLDSDMIVSDTLALPQSSAQRRLENLVSQDSEKAAKILKDWLNNPKKSAA